MNTVKCFFSMYECDICYHEIITSNCPAGCSLNMCLECLLMIVEDLYEGGECYVLCPQCRKNYDITPERLFEIINYNIQKKGLHGFLKFVNKYFTFYFAIFNSISTQQILVLKYRNSSEEEHELCSPWAISKEGYHKLIQTDKFQK